MRPVDAAFELLTDDDARDARDLDRDVADHQSRNFFTHTLSLMLTKTADGLIDPKLVLSTLLANLGAPVFFVGLLVPVREAGALLPQLPLARMTTGVHIRKWMWVAGCIVQGLMAALIVLFAFTLDGSAAGVAIVGALGVLAIGRSACSLSYKDILGKTVAKNARGTATGFSASVAAIAVIGFGLLLTSGWFERSGLVPSAIALAALFWGLAAFAMSTIFEKPAEVNSGKAEGARIASLGLLKDDPQLRLFIITRGLLVSTALAPPFMITLAGAEQDAAKGDVYGGLGLLVLASAGASFLSSYVWGRFSDRSSKWVLIVSGAAGAAALFITWWLAAAGLLSSGFMLPVMLFILMLAYHGVRVGRSTYLVDMAPADKRSAYTALSNSLIGVLVITGGAISTFAAMFGAGAAVLVLAVASLSSCFVALRLQEVQG